MGKTIRGHSYATALMTLEYMPYRAAEPVLKTLLSAGANAKQSGYPLSSLIISRALTGRGPTLKRFRMRAQGRAFKIEKKTCHITIGVRSIEEGKPVMRVRYPNGRE